MLFVAPALAQNATPNVMIILDSSGSMTWGLSAETAQTLCGATGVMGKPTWGDGSADYPGLDLDGNGKADDSRLHIAKQALRAVLQTPAARVNLGLMRYHQDEGLAINRPGAAGDCANWYRKPGDTTPAGMAGTLNYSGAAACGGQADLLVALGGTLTDIDRWIDGVESYPDDKEIRADGPTPIAGALTAAGGALPGPGNCDGNFVLLVTDGEETCAGDPVRAAGALFAAGTRVFVVGFGPGVAGSPVLDQVAQAGGTSGLNFGHALYAGDPAQLVNALTIVFGKVKCTVPCSTDYDCPGTDVCVGGHCEPRCQTNQECPNEECVDGHCKKPCTKNADCPSGICDGSYCGPPCRINSDCPPAEYCRAGQCQPRQSCSQDSDCSNQVCMDGRCQDPCRTDPECPGGAVCDRGHCVPTCTSQSCLAGTVCSGGHCDRICGSEQPCPAGQSCENGVCTGTPYDPCDSVACPQGTRCRYGACLGDGSTAPSQDSGLQRFGKARACGCGTGAEAAALGLLGLTWRYRRKRRGG
jgi:hypothetical protein